VALSNFAVSVSQGTYCLNLYGVAAYQIDGLWIEQSSATQYGIQLQGTQQGSIFGGFIHGGTGANIVLDGATGNYGYIGSNMPFIQGVSMTSGSATLAANVLVSGAGDGIIQGNHITGARVGVMVSNNRSYSANFTISDNHFEDNATAGIQVTSQRNISILGNSMYGPSADDIVITGAYTNGIIQANELNNGTTIGPAVGAIWYLKNEQLGHLTVNPSAKQFYHFGNHNDAGTPLDGAPDASWNGDVTLPVGGN
jgi:parallel beta-helix repeat protein